MSKYLTSLAGWLKWTTKLSAGEPLYTTETCETYGMRTQDRVAQVIMYGRLLVQCDAVMARLGLFQILVMDTPYTSEVWGVSCECEVIYVL